MDDYILNSNHSGISIAKSNHSSLFNVDANAYSAQVDDYTLKSNHSGLSIANSIYTLTDHVFTKSWKNPFFMRLEAATNKFQFVTL